MTIRERDREQRREESRAQIENDFIARHTLKKKTDTPNKMRNSAPERKKKNAQPQDKTSPDY